MVVVSVVDTKHWSNRKEFPVINLYSTWSHARWRRNEVVNQYCEKNKSVVKRTNYLRRENILREKMETRSGRKRPPVPQKVAITKQNRRSRKGKVTDAMTNEQIISLVLGLQAGWTEVRDFAFDDNIMRFKGHEKQVRSIVAHQLMSRPKRGKFKLKAKRPISIQRKRMTAPAKPKAVPPRRQNSTKSTPIDPSTLVKIISNKRCRERIPKPVKVSEPSASTISRSDTPTPTLTPTLTPTPTPSTSQNATEMRPRKSSAVFVPQHRQSHQPDTGYHEIVVHMPEVYRAYARSGRKQPTSLRPIPLTLPECAHYSNIRFDARLFRKYCGPFLNDKCHDRNCPFSHTLPSWRQLLEVLKTMSPAEVLIEYKAILKRVPKLFQMYFQAFTLYVGAKGCRSVLQSMIEDCEHPLRRTPINFYHIFYAYCQSGLSKSDSLKTLLYYMKTNDFEVCRTILVMILDQQPHEVPMFLADIRRFACDVRCPIDIEMIRKMILLAIETRDENMIRTVWDVISANQTVLKTLKEEADYQLFRDLTLSFWKAVQWGQVFLVDFILDICFILNCY